MPDEKSTCQLDRLDPGGGSRYALDEFDEVARLLGSLDEAVFEQLFRRRTRERIALQAERDKLAEGFREASVVGIRKRTCSRASGECQSGEGRAFLAESDFDQLS